MRVYTDASTRNHLSGLGYIATDRHHKKIQEGLTIIDQNDNNTAELLAIIFAIDETQPLLQKNESLTIFTDSTYAIGAIRDNLYRPEEEPLVKKIQNLMEYADYHLFWIKGHCQDGTILSHFNQKVDKLAKRARTEYERDQIKQKRQKNLAKHNKRLEYE